MQEIIKKELVPFPSEELQENFEFSCVAEGGTFTFHFKWLNNQWNLWVTMPDGTVRQAGVYPGVISWTGYEDYGLKFESVLEVIDYSSLFLTELYILTWA